jgi:two-component system, sensor histidine kinase and response regulator
MTDTLKILVTDDEPGMRMAVTRSLKDYTINLPDVNGEVKLIIDQAETGEEALEKIKTDPPHILLLDHKLPGISGIEVLKEISKKKTEMLTIMISAYASIETAVAATKRGAYDFLAKPFTPMELKSTISKATRHIIVARQARKLARERRQVRFQFISVLAHELKAPLGAIEGYQNIIKAETLGDDVSKYQDLVDRCLIRIHGMRKMIADLLDMTRIESGKKKRELSRVDAKEAARNSIDTLAPDAARNNIMINLETVGDTCMMADQGELEIITNNLISNAVKYNKPDGRVDVQIKEKADTLIIKVTDTGIGLTKEESAKLFNDFVRIKNENTKNVLGSGLGLSIIKKLVLLYDGSVNVKSEKDSGSTFTVILKKDTVDFQNENITEQTNDSVT